MTLADIQALKASKLAQSNLQLQSRLIDQNKNIQHSSISLNRSKAAADDNASTIFTESWANLNAWVPTTAGGTQVSGGNLYGGTSVGGGSGMNHSFQLGANDTLRAVFPVTVSMPGNGGIIIGVSSAAPGSAPASGAADAFGLDLYEGNGYILQMSNGVTSNTPENPVLTSGNYIVTITVDPIYISVNCVKTDGSIDTTARRLRSGFSVNNLFVFNSDNRGLTGGYVGACSARKGLQPIIPRTFGEGQIKTVQWTGDGTQSWRIYLPKNYDHRIPNPIIICFHGNGSDETQWSINGNMTLVQKAFVNAGFIVLTCSLNANKATWGSVDSTNAYYQAYTYLKNNYSISSVAIYANSMGGIESLNALSENLIPCSVWVGVAPTYDLLNNYQNATFTSVINTAYGIASDGSNYVTKTAGRDPALKNPSAFRCVPMMILAAFDDAAVSKTANGDKLASAVQNTAYEMQKIDVPSGGHGFDVTPYLTQIINFYNKYSW